MPRLQRSRTDKNIESNAVTIQNLLSLAGATPPARRQERVTPSRTKRTILLSGRYDPVTLNIYPNFTRMLETQTKDKELSIEVKLCEGRKAIDWRLVVQ